MFTARSHAEVLMAWSLLLLVADIFVVSSCTHHHSPRDVASPPRHVKLGRALLRPEVVLVRLRRGHGDGAGRRKSKRRRHQRHRRRHQRHRYHDDDDNVAARDTDIMAAQAINGLFGPRHFAPGSAPGAPGSAHGGKDRPGKPSPGHRTAGGNHKHRGHHHRKTGGGTDRQPGADGPYWKSFTLDLPVGCEAEPCQHDGDCYTDSSTPLGYSCRCQPGYSGDFCEIGKRQTVG